MLYLVKLFFDKLDEFVVFFKKLFYIDFVLVLLYLVWVGIIVMVY